MGQSTSRRAVVGTLAAGLAGLAWVTPTGAKSRKKGKDKKFTLCHNGETIRVPKRERDRRLRQGATAGACPGNGGASGGDIGGGGHGCGAGQKPCAGVCTAEDACCQTSDCSYCHRERCNEGTCECPIGWVRDAQGICGERPHDGACTVSYLTTISNNCCSSTVAAPTLPGQPATCVPGVTTCLNDNDCMPNYHCAGFQCTPAYLATVNATCNAYAGKCTQNTDCPTNFCDNGYCAKCSSDSNCGDVTNCYCGNQGWNNGYCVNRQQKLRPDCSGTCPPNSIGCGYGHHGQYSCNTRCGTPVEV
ncbi:MAG: hypothetical protein QM692_02920 [Thermomicrobiales bacterium]